MRSTSKRIPCFDRKRSSRISRDSATSTGRIDEPAAAMMSVNYFTGCKKLSAVANSSAPATATKSKPLCTRRTPKRSSLTPRGSYAAAKVRK
jgi:hypothetical protein